MKRAYTLIEILVVVALLAVVIALLLPVLTTARARAHTTQCSTQLSQLGHSMQLYSADYDGSVPPITIAEFVDHHASSPVRWYELLQPYLSKSSFPACPDVQVPAAMQGFGNSPGVSGYAYNGWLGSKVKLNSQDAKQHEYYAGVSDSVLNFSALTITIIEARAGIIARRSPDTGKELFGMWFDNFTAEIAAQPEGARRHNKGASYLFADGHVKWLTPEKLQTGRTCDGIHPGFGL